jgi:hypothetical protein
VTLSCEELETEPQLTVAFRIIWRSVSELIGVMPGLQELSGESRWGRGFRQVNDLQLVCNEVLEAARDICDRKKLALFTRLNPETLHQIALKHCAK